MSEFIAFSSKPDEQAAPISEEWHRPCPEPLPCEFCGKPRYFIGVGKKDAQGNIVSIDWPERDEDFALPCTCSEGLKHYRLHQLWRLHQFCRPDRFYMLQDAAKLQQYSTFQESISAKEITKIQINPDILAVSKPFNDFYVHYEYLHQLPSTSGIRKGLFLYGNPGTGKTLFALTLCRHFNHDTVPALLITGIELLDFVMAEIKGQPKLAKTFDFLKKVEVLILDDIDKITATPWAVNMLFELIDARNTAYLSTVFTSNHSIDELAKVLAKNPKTDKATVAALVDRIAGMTYPLHFTGKSWRQK